MSQIKIMVLLDLMPCGQQTDTNILEEHDLYVAEEAEDREVFQALVTVHHERTLKKEKPTRCN